MTSVIHGVTTDGHVTQMRHLATSRNAHVCDVCGSRLFGGRADRQYCSDACRQRAHRARQKDHPNHNADIRPRGASGPPGREPLRPPVKHGPARAVLAWINNAEFLNATAYDNGQPSTGGLSHRQVAAVLGVSRSTVSRDVAHVDGRSATRLQVHKRRVGAALRALRDGWTIRELAEHTDISPRTLRRWQQNWHLPERGNREGRRRCS